MQRRLALARLGMIRISARSEQRCYRRRVLQLYRTLERTYAGGIGLTCARTGLE